MREAAASDPAAAVTATPMPWDRHLRAAALASVAMAVPDRVVTNETVAEGAGVTEQWIVHRTGVHERRYVSEGERLQDLAARRPARGALEDAGVAAEDLDLVLVATLAADELLPNCAPLVAHDLGATKAGAMDVGAACTGFLSALQLATAQVEGGRADNVLVIGADVLSRFIDPDGPRHRRPVRRRRRRGRWSRPPTTAAAASATSSCAATARRPSRSAATRDEQHHPHAGTRHLQGRGLSACPRPPRGRRARRPRARRHRPVRLPPGQRAASCAAVGERLGLDDERVINSIDRYGNTSAATLPIALADARERGMVEPGMNVLLAAFGAGFTWGAGVIEWAA